MMVMMLLKKIMEIWQCKRKEAANLHNNRGLFGSLVVANIGTSLESLSCLFILLWITYCMT